MGMNFGQTLANMLRKTFFIRPRPKVAMDTTIRKSKKTPSLGVRRSHYFGPDRASVSAETVAYLKDRADTKRQRKNSKRIDNAYAGGWTRHGLSALN